MSQEPSTKPVESGSGDESDPGWFVISEFGGNKEKITNVFGSDSNKKTLEKSSKRGKNFF